MSTRTQYEADLAALKGSLAKMGRLSADAVEDALEALCTADAEEAKGIIKGDTEVNRMERDIEHRCMTLLLRQQPVAGDLRRISAALKMITDMERIGDQAEDIAEIITFLGGRGAENSNLLREMARSTIKMVTESVDAYVRQDVDLAQQVITADDEVDGYFDRIKAHLIDRIAKDVDDGEATLDLLMIAKYYERIGDPATNIAEWVMFSVTGVHKAEAT